jgi:hypothetical protein
MSGGAMLSCLTMTPYLYFFLFVFQVSISCLLIFVKWGVPGGGLGEVSTQLRGPAKMSSSGRTTIA